MAKWKDALPLDPDELKLLKADELAHDIEDCFNLYDAPIKIKKKDYDPRYGDGFKFRANLTANTTIEKVERCVKTVQHKLGLPAFRFMQKDGKLYFVTSTSSPASLNNNLIQIMASEKYKSSFAEMHIAHPVGVDDEGNVMICDLEEYPHAMVSGTTTSGKSTALRCLLVSLLGYAPDKMNVLVAEKNVKFSKFNNLPHLSYPIIREPDILTCVVLLINDEMDRRSKLEKEDEDSFSKLPYIVCLIDEFPWFIEGISNSKTTERVVKIINNILRFGRHYKIHLVLAIHDPQNPIAMIKQGDLRTRLSFQTTTARKSMTVLDEGGAEKLHGKGDMIFFHNGEKTHLQGVNICDDDIDNVIYVIESNEFDSEFPRGKFGFSISAEDIEEKQSAIVMPGTFISLAGSPSKKDDDPEKTFALATIWVLSQTNVSINSIQNCGRIPKNYGVASTIHQKLCEYGILGDEKDRHMRNIVLPKSIEDIPDELKECLSRHGISDDMIADAISKRTE